MKEITTPITEETIKNLKLGDQLSITGTIYTGRDAVLPKIVNLIEKNQKESIKFNLNGAVIMHTAFSDAGIAPTTSNKAEIESSIIPLSHEGVKFHIGKGALHPETVEGLKKEGSVFIITPPVAALLTNKVEEKKCIMFPEEGMEALYELKVNKIPGIVASINGETLF
jgi:fumarate hydratase subunit beta